MNKNKDIIDTIKLYKECDVYKNVLKNDIAEHLIPSISLNQYKVFRYDNTGVAYGFTTWAFLNKEVENKFADHFSPNPGGEKSGE